MARRRILGKGHARTYALAAIAVALVHALAADHSPLALAPLESFGSGPATDLAGDAGRLYVGYGDGAVRVFDRASQELLATLDGPRGDVYALEVDGGELYAGYIDGTVRVWDTRTFGLRSPPLVAHTNEVRDIALDEGRLYTASRDDTVKVWDRESLAQLAWLQHPLDVRGVDADGPFVVTACWDGFLRLWWTDRDVPLDTVDTRGRLEDVELDLARGEVFAGSGNGTVSVWRLGPSGTLDAAGVIQAHDEAIWDVEADDRYIYTGSFDGTVGVWDRNAPGHPLVKRLSGPIRPISGVVVINGTVYASTFGGLVWDLSHREGGSTTIFPRPSSLLSHTPIDVVPSGDEVYVLSDTGTLHAWRRSDVGRRVLPHATIWGEQGMDRVLASPLGGDPFLAHVNGTVSRLRLAGGTFRPLERVAAPRGSLASLSYRGDVLYAAFNTTVLSWSVGPDALAAREPVQVAGPVTALRAGDGVAAVGAADGTVTVLGGDGSVRAAVRPRPGPVVALYHGRAKLAVGYADGARGALVMLDPANGYSELASAALDEPPSRMGGDGERAFVGTKGGLALAFERDGSLVMRQRVATGEVRRILVHEGRAYIASKGSAAVWSVVEGGMPAEGPLEPEPGLGPLGPDALQPAPGQRWPTVKYPGTTAEPRQPRISPSVATAIWATILALGVLAAAEAGIVGALALAGAARGMWRLAIRAARSLPVPPPP